MDRALTRLSGFILTSSSSRSHSLYSHVEGVLFLLIGWMPVAWALSGVVLTAVGLDGSYDVLQSIIFLFITKVVETTFKMPWLAWSTFVIEERHGFNNQVQSLLLPLLLLRQILSLV